MVQVQAAGTTKAAETKIDRIKAALHRDHAQGASHVFVGKIDHALSGTDARQLQWCGNGGQCLFGGVEVERHGAAEKVVGAQASEHGVGVSHGGLQPAAAVTGGAGRRP